MSKVTQQQDRFIDAVFNHHIPSGVFQPSPDLGVRLGIYRNNFMMGYTQVLTRTFFMTARYMGDKFMKAAVSYIKTHLPKSNQMLHEYGVEFPECLDDTVLKELAALEWTLKNVKMLWDDESSARLFDQQDPTVLRWKLRSDVQLFQSQHAVGELYACLMQNQSLQQSLWDMVPSYYIVYTVNDVPVIFNVNAHEYQVLNHLRTGCTIQELFYKLTFSEEMFANIVKKIFQQKFLKVSDEIIPIR